MGLGRGRTSSPVTLVGTSLVLESSRSPEISLGMCVCLGRVECRRVSYIEKNGKGNSPKPEPKGIEKNEPTSYADEPTEEH